MAKMKAKAKGPMPDDVRQRLLELRFRSKIGWRMTSEETRFFEECFRKWPEDYSALGEEVNERAKEHVNPFYRRKGG